MGNGTLASPYTNTQDKASWYYNFNPNGQKFNYYNAQGHVFIPSEDQIKTGFIHWYSGVAYKTTPQLTGSELLTSQIAEIEKRIAQDTKDLESMQKALQLLNDNPEYTMLLDLHRRGLL